MDYLDHTRIDRSSTYRPIETYCRKLYVSIDGVCYKRDLSHIREESDDPKMKRLNLPPNIVHITISHDGMTFMSEDGIVYDEEGDIICDDVINTSQISYDMWSCMRINGDILYCKPESKSKPILKISHIEYLSSPPALVEENPLPIMMTKNVYNDIVVLYHDGTLLIGNRRIVGSCPFIKLDIQGEALDTDGRIYGINFGKYYTRRRDEIRNGVMCYYDTRDLPYKFMLSDDNILYFNTRVDLSIWDPLPVDFCIGSLHQLVG